MEYLMNRRFAMFVRYLVMECLTSLVANIARAYSLFLQQEAACSTASPAGWNDSPLYTT